MTTEERGLTTIEPPRQVAVSPTSAAGTLALAMMSDAEFEARLAALKQGQARQARVQRELMTENVDYGRIPGTGDKPTLLKPGAEKLCNLYGFIPEFKHERFLGDGETTPTIQIITTCYLHAGADGPVVGMGVGEANSWEKKHRYRTAERACPKCGSLATIIKGKAEWGGGWVCYAKRGGCGHKFEDNDPTIVNQQRGQVQNPDPYDLANTIVKMSEKRSYIDATLRTTATSGLFTQDLEDLAENGHRPEAPKPAATKPAPSRPVPRAPIPAAAENQEQEAEGATEAAGAAPNQWTDFYSRAKALGYKDAAEITRALGAAPPTWLAADPTRTFETALDELAALKGVKR